jgi:hypothetical protein
MFEYDVAISFAGEQREHAGAIAACLKAAHVTVFFDEYNEAALWGTNLVERLAGVYEHRARYSLAPAKIDPSLLSKNDPGIILGRHDFPSPLFL